MIVRARASTNYFKLLTTFLEKFIAVSIDCNFIRNLVIQPYNELVGST